MDARQLALKNWLLHILSDKHFDMHLLRNDASFRRYFRITIDGTSHIAMDAPPEVEDCHPFVAIAKAFRNVGVHTPEILEHDFEQGFLLLSDLGLRMYSDELNDENVDQLFHHAIETILLIQSCKEIPNWTLPQFDADFITKELKLFEHWFCEGYLGLTLDREFHSVLDTTSDLLIKSSTEQPQGCVHRDYHAANLMILDDHQVGVLDFQSAVWGPITYDAVSLFRDSRITWSPTNVTKWLEDFYHRVIDAHGKQQFDLEQFTRWFDLTGLQLHLKIIGIFARLNIRDNKSHYLQHVPRILEYVFDVLPRYNELTQFKTLLENRIKPKTMELQ